MYLQIPDYAKVQTTIDALHDSCRLADGRDDPAKGNQLLEVYGITIQLCTATNNNALMKQVRAFCALCASRLCLFALLLLPFRAASVRMCEPRDRAKVLMLWCSKFRAYLA